MDALQPWLQSQLEEGQYHSSAGFTLDSLRARAKLAEFQLPPGAWVAKMVQAAVVSQASRIDFKFGRRLVSVEFELNLPVSARDLLDKVLSGELYSESLEFHLIPALRSCCSLQFEWVEWSAGGEVVRLESDGITAQRLPPDGRQFVLRLGLPPREFNSNRPYRVLVDELLGLAVEEYCYLRSRAWTAPLSIHVDGRLFNPQFASYLLWEEERGGSEASSPPGTPSRVFRNLLAIQSLQNPSRPRLNLPALPRPHRYHKLIEGKVVNQVVFQHGSFVVWPEIEAERCGLLALVAGRICSFRVDFVLHGVTVDTFEFHLPLAEPRFRAPAVFPGIRLWWAVEPEEVDLSHFSLRDKSEVLSSFMPTVLERLEEMRSFLIRHIDQFLFFGAEERYLVGYSFFRVALLGGVTLLSGMPMAWMIGGSLAMAPIQIAMNRRLLRMGLKSLDFHPLKSFLP